MKKVIRFYLLINGVLVHSMGYLYLFENNSQWFTYWFSGLMAIGLYVLSIRRHESF